MRLVEMESLKRRVLVLGAGQRAAQIHNRMRRRADRRGFCLLGYVRGSNESVAIPEALLICPTGSLAELARAEKLHEIVVGVDDRRGSLPMDDLLACRQLGVQITDLTTFVEREAGRVQLTMLDPSWLVFSGGFNTTPLTQFAKRAFDLTASSIIALLCWPIMLGVALSIRIESGRGQPIFYRQERVGEQGRTFWLYKFRSMRTDAEMDGVARWASSNDNRVTRVGRICRKLRFDELPQLWNVLRGDMSIVGPRPERPQFVSDLQTKIRYYSLRHSIKPGLAGWAQLSYPYGASEEDAAEKLKYDLFYVKNHNLFLDMVILIETVEVVLFGRGAR
jgi:sugar transferase (PEP-CTERM system associated)